ncbi:RNA polymerase sigma factor [Persicitalea jodogahamensis]|uniref:DNA-directed RNA polymerase sigma-70 factor n=1 Tax=Persicitalea jodogahamensis TaxID=402147 RepID=A0A8J3D5V9_9BACT|nr:sigma-70 family RNA polymerase sigma factor [Persicitalea jodogahamensis]GHB54432.1 DNA-directed RNA polymerase sigma-70 factor [Persicitalea jodogahamensis]
MDTRTEGDIWTDFAAGSQEAFRELYDTYTDILYAFGLRYTADQELIKDCIHDLFIDLHTYRAGLAASPDSVKFYLLKSFRRKLNLALRKSSLFQLNGWLDRDHALPFPPFSFSIEHKIMAEEKERETLEALAYEINQLPDRQREILYLKFKHDLSYEEIAALMQVSVPTCRTLVYRGVKQLRQQLNGLPLASMLLLLLD